MTGFETEILSAVNKYLGLGVITNTNTQRTWALTHA